ncbi:MAG: hypothetical protein PF693_09815 [Spirochaetia bacterium]|jgi:hypothetical protein|nr:hypothetical protein [Spirochaetia bacterium]
MGVSVMKEEELVVIGDYVKNHIADWIKESNIIPFSSGSREHYNLIERDISLSERIVRVEEGIKHQGDLLEKMLDQMDKRFMQVDKRLEELRLDMNSRFEQVDKRLEELRLDMNSRFEQVDKRFDDVNKRFSQVQWTMGIGFTVLAALMGIFNFY